MTRIKVLTGPSVPSMMGNEEVQERTRTILYDVLDREIEKRIEKPFRGNKSGPERGRRKNLIRWEQVEPGRHQW